MDKLLQKKILKIKLVTTRTEIIYTLNKEEAYKLFIKLILDSERNKNTIK